MSMYPLAPEDYYGLFLGVRDTLREMLMRDDLTPRAVLGVAATLHAVTQLPLALDGLDVHLYLSSRIERDLNIITISIGDGELELSESGSIYTPGAGSDSWSSRALEAYVAGPAPEPAIGSVDSWLACFRGASGTWEVTFDGYVSVDPDEVRETNELNDEAWRAAQKMGWGLDDEA